MNEATTKKKKGFWSGFLTFFAMGGFMLFLIGGLAILIAISYLTKQLTDHRFLEQRLPSKESGYPSSLLRMASVAVPALAIVMAQSYALGAAMPMSQGSEVVAHATNTIMEEKMKVFLAVAGPVAGNFIAWTLITLLPVHPMILFVLAIASGILMISGIVYLTRAVDKGEAAQSKS